jgi:chromosomal replication initiator protein
LAAADLTGPSRRRQMAWARGVAMYLARTLTGQSLQSIGRAFGDRDHTTVLHGIRVTEERRSRDPAVAAEIERLVNTLGRP